MTEIMGMFSEIHASGEALRYKRILQAALETNNDVVIDFCAKEIYPLYCDAMGEAWLPNDPEVKDEFWKNRLGRAVNS